MRQARERLVRGMVNPYIENTEAWRILGELAVILKNEGDAALAFESIGRLRPDWTDEPALVNLMASLDRLGASEKTELVRRERQTFVEFFQLANQGDTNAQSRIGGMYTLGRGVARNYVEAVRWFRLAAEQGNADAVLSRYHVRLWLGVAQNDAEAVRWNRLAADQGDATAQRSLGDRYALGIGVAKNDEEVVRWYRLAANQGNIGAQCNLGNMYASGLGVTKDNAEAISVVPTGG